MKKIEITYNPYVVETKILVDGNLPKPNSALNVGKKRLQEWVEELPQIIIDELCDKNVEIVFKGIQTDYEDVVAAFDSYESKISVTFSQKRTADITDVETAIDNIWKEIQSGPIPELKDKKIADAFKKAKNSMFEINVVATMSSGKSTLINALLQKQLMPAANEATTATIVKIIDTDQANFNAVAHDAVGREVKRINNVTINQMKALNDDTNISEVDLQGKIPFVDTVGMKLVLVDTPGPNNSRNKEHEEMTYKMIADSDKSLVLYVMNGQQLGINDEKVFLDYVCQKMKEGGKQARERFIFVVNKMDSFSPKNEGEDCIETALNNVKKGLEERGIHNPNIFPVSSLSALELRTDDDEPMALDTFRRTSKKYGCLHFDEYYNFNNLPASVRKRINTFLEGADEDETVEIRTGIVSVEQAIAQYINKYARTTKVRDLVLSFNEKLDELSAVAQLEETIRKDKRAKDAMEKQISEINQAIQSAENAKEQSKMIDDIDVTDEVEDKVRAYLDRVKITLNKMMSGQSTKVNRASAYSLCDKLKKDCESVNTQINVEIDTILGNAYKQTIEKTVEEYKKHMEALNMGVSNSALTFNACNLVKASLTDLSSIISSNTSTVDEGRNVTKSKQVFVPGKRKWYNPFTWFNEGDHYETKTYQEWESKYVDYVNMREVADEFVMPLQKSLNKTHDDAISHVKKETQHLKEHLKNELDKINRLLKQKLDSLTKTEADNNAKAAEIAQKEKNLKWLEGIQAQVNNFIKF